MTLQARLILFYSFAIGAIVAIFGLTVYVRVQTVTEDQINTNLRRAASQTVQATFLFSPNEILVSGVSTFDENMVLLVWDADGNLLLRDDPTFDLTRTWYAPGLEPDFALTDSYFFDFSIDDDLFRVYTTPVVNETGRWGTMQIGVSLIESKQFLEDLSRILALSGLLTLVAAAMVTWLITSRALQPLETATEVARQITAADDLSMRIPDSPRKDEVGQLIVAFNRTLERLEELFSSQRRFLADVSHELRTPLTAIKGNADLITRFQRYDAEALHGIDQEVGRMTRMVEDLLLLAQADVNEVPLEVRPVELDTLMLESMQQASFAINDETALEIVSIDQVIVCGDRDRLKQVMLNILSNAIKYSPKDGHVRVTLGKVGREVFFSIADDGPGIAAEDVPHIFDRFYRTEKSRSRGYQERKGFGLGLSIAHWIVEKHGGRIEVDSVRGKGTKFIVWFPLAGFNC